MKRRAVTWLVLAAVLTGSIVLMATGRATGLASGLLAGFLIAALLLDRRGSRWRPPFR